MKEYYELFPDEIIYMQDEQKDVFFTGSLEERNLLTLKPCIEKGYIQEENANFINIVTIEMYNGYLKDFLENRKTDYTKSTNELMTILRRIIEPYINYSVK